MKMIQTVKTASLVGVAALALAGCKKLPEAEGVDQAETHAEDSHGGKAAWGYGEADGPAKWAALSEDFATCETGKEQSPVDLPAADKANIIEVATNYAGAKAEIVNNGHAIEAKFAEGFTLTSGEHSYNLLQFHFHTPSENTIAGESYPLTAHFVHADKDSNLAVLSVVYEEGAANAQVQAAIDNIGGTADLDVKALLPASMAAYNFKGSLTTPPCSEGVNWHVLKTPVTASAEQISALNKIMGDNARPVQPLNGRAI